MRFLLRVLLWIDFESSVFVSCIPVLTIRSKRINVDVEAQKAVFLYYNNQKNEKK